MVMQALNPKDATVLIVEDSPNDQEIVNRALKTFGIRHTHMVRTAEDALEAVVKKRYDIALIDYHLPRMNGLLLLHGIREVSPDTRVIVVTGARQESIAVAAMKAGAADYISKDEFLTSGIVRSLQMTLRHRVDVAAKEQRKVLTARSRELQEANVEGTWLLQALDERHGYMVPGQGARDPITSEWSDAVDLFMRYLKQAGENFPEPATEEEDALLRILVERGASPRDVFRIYIAAVREMLQESNGSTDSAPIRTVVFLTHALACLIEEMQTVLSLQTLDSVALDRVATVKR